MKKEEGNGGKRRGKTGGEEEKGKCLSACFHGMSNAGRRRMLFRDAWKRET